MIFDREKKPTIHSRLVNDTDAETRTFTVLDNSPIDVWIYSRSDQEIALHDGTFSKSYSGRAGIDEDIKIGDRIEQDGVAYDVSGVRTHKFGGVASLRLLLEVSTDDVDLD